MNRSSNDQLEASWPEELWQFGAASLEEADKLAALADMGNIPPSRCRWKPYGTSEVYGYGRALREYGCYPSVLPLCVDTDHGPQILYRPLLTELETNSPTILVHNRAAKARWQGNRSRSCHVMSSPFAWFRRRHNFHQGERAKGTLYFSTHSTPDVENHTAEELYAELLMNAPPEFGPLAVCMYAFDIHKNRHLAYLKVGIPVFTAGHPFDNRFMERFYRITRHFRYGASSEMGSYAFYCIEMGLPFSLMGARAAYWNNTDKNVPVGKLEYPQGFEAVEAIFAGWNREISPAQKEFALSILGQDAVPSRARVSWWLYDALLRRTVHKVGEKIRGKRRQANR